MGSIKLVFTHSGVDKTEISFTLKNNCYHLRGSNQYLNMNNCLSKSDSLESVLNLSCVCAVPQKSEPGRSIIVALKQTGTIPTSATTLKGKTELSIAQNHKKHAKNIVFLNKLHISCLFKT